MAFVEGSLGSFAAMDVRDGNSSHHGRLRRRQDLEAIAQHHEEIRLQAVEHIGKADHAEPDGLGNAHCRIGRQQHLHLGVDGKAIGLDLAVGQAELGGQMHPGDDDLKPQVGVRGNLLHQPVKEAVFGAATGDDTDCSWALHARG